MKRGYSGKATNTWGDKDKSLFVFNKVSLYKFLTVAGVAQWIERQSMNQRADSFDSQSGHMPGLQARSPVGEATTH